MQRVDPTHGYNADLGVHVGDGTDGESESVRTARRSCREHPCLIGARHIRGLKVVSGIGPVLEKTLNGYGIQTWEQLAAFTKADIDKVDDALAFPGRIERDEWLSQAKDLIKRFPLTSPYHRPTRATFLNASSDDDPWN